MTDADDDYFRKFPDHATRELLGNPDNLRDLVADVAPDFVEHFDFSRMKSVEREFRLEDWRGREADRLFELPYLEAGMEVAVLVCILVEHLSTPDAMMPFRLLQYAVLYWDRHWKRWRGEPAPRDPLRLNAVLPIVLYTGSRPWTTNHELSDLIAGPESLRALAPHWPPLVWDIAQRTPQEFLEQTGAWLRSLAVVRAEREDTETFANVLREVIDSLEELTETDRVRWHDLMRFVISWALRRRPRDEAAGLKELVAKSQQNRTNKNEVEEMIESTFQTWEQIQEEGEMRARRDDLKRVVQKKFPDAPQEVLDRIGAIDDSARLQELFDRALDAKSLDDIPL
jgi:hypothetical protein